MLCAENLLSRYTPPDRFDFDDWNVFGGETYGIVSRTSFGTVQRDRFQTVLSYRWLLRFYEAAADGDSCRFGAVGGAELGEDRADVKLGCPLADE